MIPLLKPNISAKESNAVQDCFTDNWISSAGNNIAVFEQKLAEYVKNQHVIATSSGTAALHIALLLAGVTKNDLVITSNLTFVATAHAIHYCHAKPLLVDINASNWQLDLGLLADFLEKNTEIQGKNCVYKKSNQIIRAIVPVHLLGSMANMKQVLKIAEQYKIVVVEDAAQAFGCWQDGQHSGTFGDMGCFSFNGNKVITTGGGGAIITKRADLAEKVRVLINQGRSKDGYWHESIGYNYKMSNIAASIGIAQLERLEEILNEKKRIYNHYKEKISCQFSLFTPLIEQTNHWLNVISPIQNKENLSNLFFNNGIEARPIWVPINELPTFRDCVYISEINASNQIFETSISLPSSGLSQKDVDFICGILRI